jgi:hypothetical protein
MTTRMGYQRTESSCRPQARLCQLALALPRAYRPRSGLTKRVHMSVWLSQRCLCTPISGIQRPVQTAKSGPPATCGPGYRGPVMALVAQHALDGVAWQAWGTAHKWRSRREAIMVLNPRPVPMGRRTDDWVIPVHLTPSALPCPLYSNRVITRCHWLAVYRQTAYNYENGGWEQIDAR